MNKSELRSHFKDLLSKHAASPEAVSKSQEQLVQHTLEFLKPYSGTWGVYQPLPQEASLRAVTEARKDIRWVYPRMKEGHLVFCIPELWEKVLFGIRQPTVECEVVPLDKIQGLLIPGLAFDRQGNRLGRGKGFYDQALSTFRGIKAGVGFSFQLSETLLPAEPHDVQMNFVITGEGIEAMAERQA